MQLPPTWPETELIEVTRVASADQLSRALTMPGDEVAIWDGPQVQQALTLIRALPPGQRMRCFTPVWGIRAHSATRQLFEVVFCFSCHAAQIWGSDFTREQQVPAFDADSPVAQDLLGMFRACLPT